MQRIKRSLTSILVLVFIFTSLMVGYVAAKDFKGHWAEENLEKWLDNGLLIGYDDEGTVKPNAEITRSEFVMILFRIFKFIEVGKNNFSDVKSGDWFEDVVLKAHEAGIVYGYNDGSFKPKQSISREQAAAMINRGFGLVAENNDSIKAFKDFEDVADYAKGDVAALVENGYIQGRGNDKFFPDEPITRAEAVTIFENIVEEFVFEPSTIGGDTTKKVIKGNLLVNSKDVILKNLQVTGNIYLTQGIGEGEIVLDNVIVDGELVANGGGQDSITIKNSTITKILANKKNGKLRILAEGNTEIKDVIAKNGVKLEEKLVTGKGFGNVEIQNVSVGHKLELAGDFDNVKVDAPKAAVEMISGKIGNLNVAEKALDSNVLVKSGIITSCVVGIKSNLEFKGGTIGDLNVTEKANDAVVNFTGIDVKITSIIVNAKATIDMAAGLIDKIEVSEKATDSLVQVSGATVTKMDIKSKTVVKVISGIVSEIDVIETAVDTEIDVSENGLVAKLKTTIEVIISGQGEIGEVVEGDENGENDNNTTQTPDITIDYVKAVMKDGTDVIGNIDGPNATINLKLKNDNDMLTGLKIGPDAGVLYLNGISSEKLGTMSISEEITNPDNISVSVILGDSNNDVSVGTLRSYFGNSITLSGTLVKTGYNSKDVSVIFELSTNEIGNIPNEYVEVTTSGKTLTASIIDGKGNTNVATIGIASTCEALFGDKPDFVSVNVNDTNGWYDPDNQSAQIATAIAGLASKTWGNLKLSDLIGKRIYFKEDGDIYTVLVIPANEYFYLAYDAEKEEVTATIKEGKGTKKLSEIGISDLIFSLYSDIPDYVKVRSTKYAVGSQNTQIIEDIIYISGKSSWNNVTLNDLASKTIYIENGGKLYTIKIVS